MLVAGDALEGPDVATTVRERDGKIQFTDGPFAETKEFLAGYYLVDCPDLDTALDYASRLPAVGLADRSRCGPSGIARGRWRPGAQEVGPGVRSSAAKRVGGARRGRLTRLGTAGTIGATRLDACRYADSA